MDPAKADDVASLGSRLEKAWGWSAEVFRDAKCRLVLAVIDKGGFSSIHVHDGCFNSFDVIEGTLLVEEFCPKTFAPKGKTQIDCGDKSLCIGLRRPHRFVAKTDVIVYKLYRAAPGLVLDPNDIRRFSHGGRAGDVLVANVDGVAVE
jgi:hypothetical protein